MIASVGSAWRVTRNGGRPVVWRGNQEYLAGLGAVLVVTGKTFREAGIESVPVMIDGSRWIIRKAWLREAVMTRLDVVETSDRPTTEGETT